jgi:membrane peptidoglycan carboxypeptidase
VRPKKSTRKPLPARRRPNKAAFTTRSGNSIKLPSSLKDRFRANKDAKARRKAAYLSGLPKNRFKRMLYRMHPKRMAAYWFSKRGALMALKITGIGILVVFIFVVGLFAYFRKDLPNITDISGDTMGGNITYFDRSGEHVLWQDYDAVKRVPVPSDEISEYVKQATVAIEDQNFYEHGAFDLGGIARAVSHNVFNRGGTLEGGSTITQQTVKLSQDWTEDRTIGRKIKELILAVELEREYSKDDILTGYLNLAPYGTIQYGVEAAAQDYFHKSAKNLSLAESAFLAAIPKSPSLFSPYGPYYDPEDLIGRQQYILDRMAEQGMVTQEEADKAKKVNILAQVHPLSPKYQGIQAPYYTLAAKEQLNSQFGALTVQRGGWEVTTALDWDKQKLAEEQVANGIGQIQAQGGDTAAFAAVDVETAQVVALVGGPDFNNEQFGQVNYARERIPPGSSFKPYDYASLIEHTDTAGAGSVMYDIQGELPGYPCTNKQRPQNGGNCLWDYDFRYPGPTTLRYSLGASRNVPAVKSMLTVGVEKTIETAEKMGLTSGYNCYEDAELTVEGQCYASAAIGDGAYLKLDEHVNSFATFSRMGKTMPHTYILKIKNAQGDTLYEWEKPQGEQAIRADTAYIIANILSDPRASYMSTKIQDYNGWKFAVKTGTTNDNKDGLMMGFSGKYAAGVWVGYHNRQVEMSGFMESMTRPIWLGWMQAAHDGVDPVNWEKPSGVKEVDAYVQRSHVGTSTIEPGPSKDLAPSWYKDPEGDSGGNRTIDIVSKKLATSCTPDLARRDEGGANDNKFSVDIFVGTNSNTDDSDDVHDCNDTKPSISLTSGSTCQANTNCAITVTVTRGTHPLSSSEYPGKVTLYANGNNIGTREVSDSPSTIHFSQKFGSSGNRTIRAVVTDSVLYESEQSTTLKVTGGSSTPSTPDPEEDEDDELTILYRENDISRSGINTRWTATTTA